MVLLCEPSPPEISCITLKSGPACKFVDKLFSIPQPQSLLRLHPPANPLPTLFFRTPATRHIPTYSMILPPLPEERTVNNIFALGAFLEVPLSIAPRKSEVAIRTPHHKFSNRLPTTKSGDVRTVLGTAFLPDPAVILKSRVAFSQAETGKCLAIAAAAGGGALKYVGRVGFSTR